MAKVLLGVSIVNSGLSLAFTIGASINGQLEVSDIVNFANSILLVVTNAVYLHNITMQAAENAALTSLNKKSIIKVRINGSFIEISGSESTLKPVDLMRELANSSVNYTESNVIMVTKASNNQLMWLETGNNRAGFAHIIYEHAADLTSKGIPTDAIPIVIKQMLQTPPIATGATSVGPYADYLFLGNRFRLAYGQNGFIVSFYPVTI